MALLDNSKRWRIDSLSNRYFPDYHPAHFVYKNLIYQNADLKKHKILHFGCGYDSYGIYGQIGSNYVYSMDKNIDSIIKNKNRKRVLGDGYNIPFGSETFDLIGCEDVFEHIEYPDGLLKEFNRILKKEGKLIFLTPNKYSYISIIARATPLWFHRFYHRFQGGPVRDTDIFPTFYRLNTIKQLLRLASSHGFLVEELHTFVGGPSYFYFSITLHRLFIHIHRILERYNWLKNFRITIVGVFVKKLKSKFDTCK